MTRYDVAAMEAADAGFYCVSSLADGCRLRELGWGNRQDSAGAKLRGDELHDGVQRASGNLRNRLLRSIRSASERVQQRYPAEQHGKHGLYISVQHDPAHMPNKLRPLIAVSVIFLATAAAVDSRTQPRAAMVSRIGSRAFSVAALPAAMASVAR